MDRPVVRKARSRPLRWTKFAGGLAAAALTLSLATPAVRLLARVIVGPFLEAPPLPALLPSLLSALVAIAGLGWLTADASFDRRAPRWLIVLLVANLMLLSWARPSQDLRMPASDTEVAAALLEVKGLAGDLLGTTASLQDGLHALLERTEELPRTSIRDRLFRSVAPTLLILEERDGPLLTIPDGAAPATIFLAINPARSAAWLTAATLDGGQVALLRNGGLPVVLGIPLCPSSALPNALPGGTPC